MRALAAIACAAGLLACAPAPRDGPAARPGGPAPGPLPAYAAPSGGVVDPGLYDESDLVPYRTLTRADFRASEPPPHFAAVRDRIGAATCAYVRTTPETHVRYEPFRAGGRTRYRTTVASLAFVAYMDRSCSWWNEGWGRLPEEYVLEHEQIHLALFEIESRRLNARSDAIAASLRVSGDSPREVQRLAQERLTADLDAALQRALQRNVEFDRDTSFGYRPERQAEWRRRVQAELDAAR